MYKTCLKIHIISTFLSDDVLIIFITLYKYYLSTFVNTHIYKTDLPVLKVNVNEITKFAFPPMANSTVLNLFMRLIEWRTNDNKYFFSRYKTCHFMQPYDSKDLF